MVHLRAALNMEAQRSLPLPLPDADVPGEGVQLRTRLALHASPFPPRWSCCCGAGDWGLRGWGLRGEAAGRQPEARHSSAAGAAVCSPAPRHAVPLPAPRIPGEGSPQPPEGPKQTSHQEKQNSPPDTSVWGLYSGLKESSKQVMKEATVATSKLGFLWVPF